MIYRRVVPVAALPLLLIAAACGRSDRTGYDTIPPLPGELAPPDAVVGRDTSYPPGVDTARATSGGATTPAPPQTDRPMIPGGTPTTPPASRPDTVRGTIAVTGSHPFASPVLRPVGGGSELAITGPDSAIIAGVAGLEVEAHGRRNAQNRTFRVDDFIVRASAGEPVLDGTLIHRGAELVLRTAEGDVTIRNPPHALHELVGSRIWLGGSVETGPNTFGVIRRGDGESAPSA